MPRVEFVKCVTQLPHVLLSLYRHKALLFHVTESALEGGVRAVPSQPSGISELAPPEYRTNSNQPWP